MKPSVKITLDTPIGSASGKDTLYGQNGVKIQGGYAAATEGRMLALRMLAEQPNRSHDCLIPSRAATPGAVTSLKDGSWSTQLGNKKAKISPDTGDPDAKPFPTLDGVLRDAKDVRWAHLDGKLLARLAKAIGHGKGAETQSEIFLGIGTEPDKPAIMLAGDLRAIGLLMPMRRAAGDPKWTQEELSERFNAFCNTYKKETSDE